MNRGGSLPHDQRECAMTKMECLGRLGKRISQVVFFSVLVFVIAQPIADAYAASNRAYEAQRLKLVENLQQTLIREGACADKNDCVKKQLVFASPEADGIEISLYGLEQARTLSELVKACSDAYFENNFRMAVRIRIYRVTKAQDLASPAWKSNKVSEISFSGGK